MKTKARVPIILVAVLVMTAALIIRRPASADPPEDNTHLIHLPVIRMPNAPPTLEIVPFASGFEKDDRGATITAITHAGDERLFVSERKGLVRIVEPDGTLQKQPFLDIKSIVKDDNWEEGLLGLVFHPAYPGRPFFYVVYTDSKHRITLSRFRVSDDDPNLADRESRLDLLSISKPGNADSNNAYRVHNAGDLHFGPDGYLYMSVGDGGPDPWYRGGDPHNSGQGLDELLGNILRLDVNESNENLAPDCGSKGYRIPATNPFTDGDGGNCDEVWSLGFRNPYRFSFDRLTGDLFIGDVGEKLWEEINFQPAESSGGENYGWHCYEGTTNYETVDPDITGNCSADTEFVAPIYEYDQSNDDCSVIGGYVYRGSKYQELYGRYVFGDFCTGRMWILSRDSNLSWTRSFGDNTKHHISTFGEDVNGELYFGEFKASGSEGPSIFKVVVAP